MNERNSKGASTEVVDGQQRLTTIRDFINNDYSVQGEISKKIVLELKETLENFSDTNDKSNEKLLKKLQNKNGFSLKYSDFPQNIRDNIIAYPLSIMSISNSSEIEITEYFNFLQNQEILRAGEIINSIPATTLEQYLLLISDKTKFLKLLGFSNKRKEFDKIFYSIMGLFDNKINFGTTDKEIQNYVAGKKGDLAGEALSRTLKMTENLNLLINLDCDENLHANKRFLKLLLLIAGFNSIEFFNNLLIKIKKLKKINDMISSFNSAKKGIVEETFIGFTRDEIEDYRLIALFTKGAQTYENAQKRCIELAEKINTDTKIKVE